MASTYYRIGEVSRATGISKDTLHFYDRIGLLVPDHIDPENQYRYYSLRNLWQLDIITTCRKLDIPLDLVRQILALHDNARIVELLMEYRQEALRRSDYYRRVADDILWYSEESRRIESLKGPSPVQLKQLPQEMVLAGAPGKAYHANLQAAAREQLRSSPTIRRRYGYVLDPAALPQGRVVKEREYMKSVQTDFDRVPPENRYLLPAGSYAVCTVRIRDEKADFTPLLNWLERSGRQADLVYAEELGLQLFPYLDDYTCEVRAHLLP